LLEIKAYLYLLQDMYIAKTQIIDQEFPLLIEYFDKVMGSGAIKKIMSTGRSAVNKPYWYGYLKQYKKWILQGARISDITSNLRLMEFGIRVKGIQAFALDWDTADRRDQFIGRLRDSKRVEGLLFEIRTGTHFLEQGLDVHLIINMSDEKASDLQINAEDGGKVVIECVLRSPSISRELYEIKLVEDLLKAASDKLESKHDWGCPRLVAVKVPESIDWGDITLRKRIKEKINHWFKQERLASVNALFLMGKESMTPWRDRYGRVIAYYPDQQVFLFRNQRARYPLPESVNSKLIQASFPDGISTV